MHRTLILSCNTGEGHNSAAKAIKEVYDAEGESCEIVDALSLLSPRISDIISRGHVGIYRKIPRLFSTGYKIAEKVSAKGEKGALYGFMARGAESLNKLIKDSGCTACISVHPFSGMMLTETVRRYSPEIVTGIASTDYTCSPYVNHCDMDYYFIPHENLKEEFISCGIPEERIVPSGIPVRQRFYKEKSLHDARRELNIDENDRLAVLMCGSMGCGPMKKLAENIAAGIKGREKLVVICGSNEKLREQLKKRVSSERVEILGYTDKISLYMDAADILITKPGGLSSTEAAAKGLPMVLIDAVAGCEDHNMNFYVGNGWAVTGQNKKELTCLVTELLGDDKKRAEMSGKLRDNFCVNSARIIYDTMMKGCAR